MYFECRNAWQNHQSGINGIINLKFIVFSIYSERYTHWNYTGPTLVYIVKMSYTM